MIASTGKEEVHVLVVYLGTRDVLHPNPERRRDVGRKWTAGDGALRRYHDGAGEEARKSLELHLVGLLGSLEMDTPLDRFWSLLEAQPLALILQVARESARLVVRIVFIPSSPLLRCRSFSCESHSEVRSMVAPPRPGPICDDGNMGSHKSEPKAELVSNNPPACCSPARPAASHALAASSFLSRKLTLEGGFIDAEPAACFNSFVPTTPWSEEMIPRPTALSSVARRPISTCESWIRSIPLCIPQEPACPRFKRAGSDLGRNISGFTIRSCVMFCAP
jgi:hypothetical protein